MENINIQTEETVRERERGLERDHERHAEIKKRARKTYITKEKFRGG